MISGWNLEVRSDMTEKELHRLHRQDLLQLLLSQGKEALALQTKLNEVNTTLIQTQTGYERLKDKLDDKDALIEKLKRKLDRKDARIRELEKELRALRLNRKIQLEEAGSIAEAALKLNDVFEVAQKAADQYLYNLQRMSDQKIEELYGKADEKLGWEDELLELEPLEADEEETPVEIDEEDLLPDVSEEEEARNEDEEDGDGEDGTDGDIPEFGRS